MARFKRVIYPPMWLAIGIIVQFVCNNNIYPPAVQRTFQELPVGPDCLSSSALIASFGVALIEVSSSFIECLIKLMVTEDIGCTHQVHWVLIIAQCKQSIDY